MWVLIFLLVGSWFDLKRRSLPVWFLNLASVPFGIFRLCNWKNNMLLWIGGAGIGILFFFISKYTKEAIGYGDSWIIFLLGIYLGLWDLLWLLSITFTLTGVLAAFLMAFHKCSRKIVIPFVPFLAIAYVGVMYL